MFKEPIDIPLKFSDSPYSELVGFDGYRHRAIIKASQGDDLVIKWHWPRGTFDARMSAYEMALILVPHMTFISPYIQDKVIREEFDAMLVLLATSPRRIIDEILPWIRPTIRTDDNDIVVLQLSNKFIDPAPKKIYFGAPCH